MVLGVRAASSADRAVSPQSQPSTTNSDSSAQYGCAAAGRPLDQRWPAPARFTYRSRRNRAVLREEAASSSTHDGIARPC